jgi:hypothetical protein
MKNLPLLLLFFSALSSAGNWSRFIVSKNQEGVNISFRQQKQNNAWHVEWQVRNDSDNTVEPILKKRTYICNNNFIQVMGAISLGSYQSHQQRHGDLIDTNICPNSSIKIVEIETEITNVNTAQ